jgi:hypothetical protein
MSNNYFNKNCPYYVEANCNHKQCRYRFHSKCYNNLTCFDFGCSYGHAVSQNMRKLFKEIVDDNKNPEYEKSENKCSYSINCFNPNCTKDHMVLTDAMKFINHVYRERISYEDSYSMYKLQFKNESPTIAPINDPIDSTLETNLLNLTEIEEEPTTPINSDREDMKSTLLQELMECQTNINKISKELYENDIKIQNLFNKRKFLTSEMFKNRSKINQLTITLNIIHNS